MISQQESGTSVESVDALIRKHDNFEKTLLSQCDKIDALKGKSAVLDETSDPDAERIRSKYDEVLERYDQLLAGCKAKRRRLEESRKLHDFIRSCGEFITWMNAKLQLAYDEEYTDATSLRSKLQKHLAFETELQASEERVDAIRTQGERLIYEDHYEKETVVAQMAEVTNGWRELKTYVLFSVIQLILIFSFRKSANKTKLLKDSYEAYQFARKLEELDKWMDNVDNPWPIIRAQICFRWNMLSLRMTTVAMCSPSKPSSRSMRS